MIHPIIDEYYNHSPSYVRSSKFAKDKGLVSNAPGDTQGFTPATGGGHTPALGAAVKTTELDAVKERLEEVQRRVSVGQKGKT